MKTLYKEADNRAYSINETFTRKIGEERYFVATRHGGWVILNQNELNRFKSRTIDFDSDLFQRMKDAGIILTADSLDKIRKDLEKKHSRLVQPPTYHVIPVSEACNMNCVYCHPDAKPGKEKMDRDMARQIMEFITSIPNLHGKTIKIVLTGGEPLTNFDVVRFVVNRGEELAEENEVKVKFSIQTNLTLMDDEMAKFIGKNNINVGTSIDGPKELHNAQRPYASGGGTYEDIVYWIKRLKNKHGVSVGAIATLTALALDYDPKEIVDTYRELDQGEVFIKPYRPEGRAKGNKELVMDPGEFFKFYRGTVEYILQLWKQGERIRERTTREFVDNFLSPTRRCMCRDRPCGAGTTMLSWTKNGDVIACDSLRSEDEAKLGNIAEDSYLDIRAAALPLISMTTDVIPECSQCAYQAFCGTCPGNAFGEMDDPMPKPPLNFECKWQKRAFDYLVRKFLNDQDASILKSWSQEYQKKTRKKTSHCPRN